MHSFYVFDSGNSLEQEINPLAQIGTLTIFILADSKTTQLVLSPFVLSQRGNLLAYLDQ